MTPAGIGFDLTYRCNQDCGFCYNPLHGEYRAKFQELDTNTILRIWDLAAQEKNPHYAVLTGGEPLMRSDLLKLVTHFAASGARVLLISNGTLMTKTIAHELASAGLSKVQITLLGNSPVFHDILAGNGSFKRTLQGILACLEEHIEVCTNFVETCKNVGNFPETVELNRLLGIREIGFCMVNPGSAMRKSNLELIPSAADTLSALVAGNALLKDSDARIFLETPLPLCLIDVSELSHVTNRLCKMIVDPGAYILIDPAGNLKLCPLYTASFGNVLDSGLHALLQQDFRGSLSSVRVTRSCLNCPSWDLCRGGCPAIKDMNDEFGVLAYKRLWDGNLYHTNR